MPRLVAAPTVLLLLIGCGRQPEPIPGSQQVEQKQSDILSKKGGPLKDKDSKDTPILLLERASIPAGFGKDGVGVMALSPDGKTVLASGYKPYRIVFWDVKTAMQTLVVQDELKDAVLSLAVSPTNTVAHTASYGEVILRDLQSGKVTKILKRQGKAWRINHLAFAPKGDLLLGVDGREVIGWDPTSGKEVFARQADDQQVRQLTVFPDGKRFATSGDDGAIKVWDVAKDQPTRVLTGVHKNPPDRLAVSPDGKTLVARGFGEPIRVWNVETGKWQRDLDQSDFHGGLHMVFLLDGTTLVSSDVSGQIYFWNVETGARVHHLKGHEKVVRRFAVGPDGATLVSASGDDSIKIWDLKINP
jgi:WD40 repeat protein